MKNRNDEIDEICAYCENAVVIRESDICICKIHGAVMQSASCKKFSLDMLKLTPRPRMIPDDDSFFVEI